MAYKRRRTTRRPMKRRRGFKRRRTGWGGYLRTGMSLARQVWKLKGLVNSEMFKYDVAFTPTSVTTAPITNLCAVAQGDGDAARTGNSIFCRSWNFSGSLIHNSSGATTQFVRISVIMDSQQISDTLPTYSNIYESSSPYAHLNSDTVGRYKVLFSQMYMVNNSDKAAVPVRINLPMRHHVRYNGAASGDIQRGGLYLCIATDEPTANYPTWQGEYRLSYHDN